MYIQLYYICYLMAIGKARESANFLNPLESFGWTCVAYCWLSKMVKA